MLHGNHNIYFTIYFARSRNSDVNPPLLWFPDPGFLAFLFIYLMGRTKNKNKLSPFVPLTWIMLNSNAYKELNGSAAKALPFFLGKGRNKHNNIEFEFTYTEADKRYGFSTRTFARIIIDLTEKGFIEKTALGGLRGFEKSNNKYKLSENWLIYGNTIEVCTNGIRE